MVVKFKSRQPPRCGYCRHGEPVSSSEIVCVKQGVVSPEDKCVRYKYDPTKRTPEVMRKKPKKYEDGAFEI